MRRSVMRMGMGGQVRSPFFLLEVDFCNRSVTVVTESNNSRF